MKNPICNSRFVTPRFCLAALFAGAGLLGGSAVHGADGIWNKFGGSWADVNNWAGGTIADGAGFTATFGTEITADAVITLDGARTIGNLTFGDLTPSHNWILNPGSAGPLTLDVAAGSSTITVNNQTATIAVLLTGDDAVVKAGAGTLVLNNPANTLRGDFTVNAGILRLAGTGNGTTSSLGVSNVARNINVNAGTTVQFTNHDTFGNAGVNPALVFNVNGGTLSNVGFNAFTTLGAVNLTNGTITSSGGAAQQFQAFQLKGTVTSSGNSFINTTGTAANFNGFHVTNNTFNVTDGTLAVSAPLVNAGDNAVAGFTKTGGGTMVLSAVNAYTGNTLVSGGVLQVAAGGSITTSAKMLVSGGAELVVNGTMTMPNTTEFSVGSGIAGTTGTVTINPGGVLNVGGGGGYAVLGGRNSLANAFGSGTMTINGGTVNIAAPGTGSSGPGGLDATSFWMNPYGANAGVGSIINLNAGTLSSARGVNDGGSAVSRLRYNGGTFQAAAAISNNSFGLVRNGGAKFDTQTFNMTMTGPLRHSDIVGDNALDGGLIKTGTGTLTLAGANTFTGDIVINAGTVTSTVSANNTNPTASGLGDLTIAGRKITINAGATLSFATANDALGQFDYKTPVTFVVDGGTLSHGNQFFSIGNVELKNGATMTGVNGVSPVFSGFALNGSITVSGTGRSVLSTTGGTNPGTNLGSAAVPFIIGSTGAAGADFVVTSPLLRGATGLVGGLVKSGPGTMLLDYPAYSGSTLYNGPTVINEGTLLVNGALNPVTTVTLATGTGFGRTGGGSVTVTSLALANIATLSAAANPDTATAGSIVVTATDAFTAGGGVGSVTVNVGGGGLAAGTSYALVNYTGNFAGAENIFVLGTKPSRTLGNLVLNAGNSSLDFAVTSVDSVRWTGAASSEWSTAVLMPTKNFALQSNASPTDFLANDSVTFNDTAIAKTVNINAADVTIGVVKFDNAQAYTLAGSKGMTGAGSVTKTGSGSLTITNANSYTGGTAINQGTITTVAGGLGTAGPVSFGGGSLQYATGNTQDISARIANSTAVIRLDTNGNNVSFAGAIPASNTGGLIKTGAGTLILASAGSSYTGDVLINAGTVSVTGGLLGPAPVTGALGNPSVQHQVVVNNARLEFRMHDIFGNDAANPLVSVVLNESTLASVPGFLTTHPGPFNILPAITLNGSRLTASAGALSTVQSFSLKGTVTVTGTTPSFIDTTGTAAQFDGVHLTQTDGNIFEVADATSNSAVDLTVSARIINRGGNLAVAGLIKRGEGTMLLSHAANGYTGTTTVEAGTLLLGGNISGSDVTVSATANFGGAGTMKSLLVKAGGKVSPSDPLTPNNGIGTLTVTGDVALFGTTTIDMRTDGTTLSADLISSSTQIVYGGTLALTISGFPKDGDVYNLFDAPQLNAGTFDAILLPGLTTQGLSWDTSKLTQFGTLAVVPEPGSVMLLLGGLGAVAGFRRRRRA